MKASADRMEIVETMLASGHSRKQIAERLGITCAALSFWMKRHGMPPRYTHIQQMHDLICKGEMTTLEIAESLGITRQAVEQYCTTHDLTPKRLRRTFTEADEIELTVAADVIRAVARRIDHDPAAVAYALARRLDGSV